MKVDRPALTDRERSDKPADAVGTSGSAHAGGHQLGRSLLELVITMAIVGIIATIAFPATKPKDELRLALAAESIADALRFTREQASLSGQPHGISVSSSLQELRVFRLDQTVDPPASVYDVYHPVSKQLYTINFAASVFEALSVFEPQIKSPEPCNDSSGFIFDAHGAVFCLNPVTRRVVGVGMDFELDGRPGQVTVNGYTGRVQTL